MSIHETTNPPQNHIREFARRATIGCVTAGAIAVGGGLYTIRRYFDSSDYSRPIPGAATEAPSQLFEQPDLLDYSSPVPGVATNAPAQSFEQPDPPESFKELPVDLSPLDLPEYDPAARESKSGIVELTGADQWNDLQVGNLRVAVLNRTGRTVDINTNLLGEWFARFGLVDARVTADLPLFYALMDEYTANQNGFIDTTLRQYAQVEGMPDGLVRPFCSTGIMSLSDGQNTTLLSASMLSLNDLGNVLKDGSAQAAQSGGPYGVKFGSEAGKPFMLSGDAQKDVQNFANACVVGELLLGYRGQQRSNEEWGNIEGNRAFDFGSWVEVGEQFTDEQGNFPEDFLTFR